MEGGQGREITHFPMARVNLWESCVDWGGKERKDGKKERIYKNIFEREFLSLISFTAISAGQVPLPNEISVSHKNTRVHAHTHVMKLNYRE